MLWNRHQAIFVKCAVLGKNALNSAAQCGFELAAIDWAIDPLLHEGAGYSVACLKSCDAGANFGDDANAI